MESGEVRLGLEQMEKMEVSPMRMLSFIITSLNLWGFLDYQNKVKIGPKGSAESGKSNKSN